MNEETFGGELAGVVETLYRRGHPDYALEREREELGRWREEHSSRLQRERYEALGSSRRRELAERRAAAERARAIEGELAVLFGPFGLRIGSPVPEGTAEDIKRHLRARLDVPPGELEAVVDGLVAHIEVGDGRGARELVAEAAARWAAAGGTARPEPEDELDPRRLAAQIPRRPVFTPEG